MDLNDDGRYKEGEDGSFVFGRSWRPSGHRRLGRIGETEDRRLSRWALAGGLQRQSRLGPEIDREFWFGQAGDIFVIGDWQRTGRMNIGVFRRGQWLLDCNGNGIAGSLTRTSILAAPETFRSRRPVKGGIRRYFDTIMRSMTDASRILDAYVHTAPSAQNAVDIMKGEWASRFPCAAGATIQAGQIPLFEDSRIDWAIRELGGVRGLHVLELGPLEGGHSYMLERNGAASVLAIEANTRAFIKCLITKEVLGLEKVKFSCGDFREYLAGTTEQFDMILASGVLYHMRDPVRLVAELAQHTRRLYLWTHYWDPMLLSNPGLRHKFPSHAPAETLGFKHTLYRQEYQASLDHRGFCGGSDSFSHWLNRAELLSSLSYFGFTDVRIGHEQREHPNGPCLGIIASK